LEIVTKGNEFGDWFVLQFEHEPQEPPRFNDNRSQACRARNPAATATIEMAMKSCIRNGRF
jgi:hypothetical protein